MVVHVLSVYQDLDSIPRTGGKKKRRRRKGGEARKGGGTTTKSSDNLGKKFIRSGVSSQSAKLDP